MQMNPTAMRSKQKAHVEMEIVLLLSVTSGTFSQAGQGVQL